MKATITLDASTINGFKGACDVMISKVGNGSRKAVQEACEHILNESLKQVPIETGALMNSASYRITGDYKTGWHGQVGYCIDIDYVNPKTGKAASTYVLAVHENLKAKHPVGKAKFLEDPAREYAQEKFPRTVFTYMRSSLASGGK